MKMLLTLAVGEMRAKSKSIFITIAISLSMLLFTSVSIVGYSLFSGYENTLFYENGSKACGGYKDISLKQALQLAEDYRIEEYGISKNIAYLSGNDESVDEDILIMYADAKSFEWMTFGNLVGTLPTSGSNEAVCSTGALDSLNVRAELGTEFCIDIDEDGISEKFILSGYWYENRKDRPDYVFVPENIYGDLSDESKENVMSVILSSGADVETQLNDIALDNGFQTVDKFAENYVTIGVNAAYLNKEPNDEKTQTAAYLVAIVLLLLIFIAGYLIIYNIFSVSIRSNINHFSLLKAIGLINEQIYIVVCIELFFYNCMGLLIGGAGGKILAGVLTRKISSDISQLFSVFQFYDRPSLYLIAGILTTAVVFLTAVKSFGLIKSVFPLDATTSKYDYAAYGSDSKKPFKNAVWGLALNIIKGEKKKIIISIISISLSLFLFQTVYDITESVDVDKFKKQFGADCVLIPDENTVMIENTANVDVFEAVTEDDSRWGSIYTENSFFESMNVSEEYLREEYPIYYGIPVGQAMEEEILSFIAWHNKKETLNEYEKNLRVYGADNLALDCINCLSGDLGKINSADGYVAIIENGHTVWSVGDMITVSYYDYQYYDDCGKICSYNDFKVALERGEYYSYNKELIENRQYEIVAVCSFSELYSWDRSVAVNEIIVSEEEFDRVCNSEVVVSRYAIKNLSSIETEKIINEKKQLSGFSVNLAQDYVETLTYFMKVVKILGYSLSIVVGIIGLLNLINSIAAFVTEKKNELTLLRAIGMTLTQQRKMLITVFLSVAAGASAIILLLSLFVTPLIVSIIETNTVISMNYSFSYLSFVLVVLIIWSICVILPSVIYFWFSRKSVVERLRESV